jgi:hypothetical protein
VEGEKKILANISSRERKHTKRSDFIFPPFFRAKGVISVSRHFFRVRWKKM